MNTWQKAVMKEDYLEGLEVMSLEVCPLRSDCPGIPHPSFLSQTLSWHIIVKITYSFLRTNE